MTSPTNLPISQSTNPYVGPRTFSYEQRHLFFGREREARDLLARVLSERLLLFYAQSGAGKSSLLNTRLIPALQEEKGFMVLPVARVSGELPAGVAQVDNIFAFNLMLSIVAESDPARLAGVTLSDFLARLALRPAGDGQDPARKEWVYDAAATPAPAAPNGRRYALIVDQFEEIITSHPARWQEREAFFRQLDAAMQADPNLWVVLSLREDYVAALDPYAPLVADRLRARFFMQRMAAAAALDAIRRPAELAGRSFAPGVAEKLVDDLRQVRVAGQAATVAGQYVEPVQLQVVCYQLWENLGRGSGGTEGTGGTQITFDDLAVAGDVNTALTQFYEETLAAALADPAAAGVSERQLRVWFDEKLITEAGTRGLVHQGESETGGLPNGVVRALQRRFLVRAEARGGDAWIELVHDRFVDPIRASNAAWFPVHLSPLQRQAALWDEQGRSSGLLLRDAALVEAEGWAAAHPDVLEADEREFLTACREAQAAAEREQRQSRLIRILGVAAVGVAVLAFVAAGLALFSSQQTQTAKRLAEENAGTAEVNASIALSRQLAAESDSRRKSEDFVLGLLLAIEAGKAADTPEAQAALREAVVFPGRIAKFAGRARFGNQIHWSPDDSLILTSSQADGTARIWDPQTGTQLSVVYAEIPDPMYPDAKKYETVDLLFVAWCCGGDRFLTFSRWRDVGTVDLYDVGREVTSESIQPKKLASLTGQDPQDPDRYWTDGSTIRLAEESDMHSSTGEVVDFQELETPVWNHTKTSYLGLCDGDKLCLFNGQTESDLPTVQGHEGGIRQVRLSTEGDQILMTGDDGFAQIAYINTPRSSVVLSGLEGIVSQGRWSPDGRRVLTAGNDMTVRIWDATTGRQLEPALAHDAPVIQAAWDSDGSRILTTAKDGTIRVWDTGSDQALVVFDRHGSAVRQATWSPDGTRILTVEQDDSDGVVRLWDSRTGAEVANIRSNDSLINRASWNQDGDRILTAGADGTARLWNADTGAPLLSPFEHVAGVSIADWSPNETMILTVSDDGSAFVWDAANGTKIAPMVEQSGRILSAAWSPDSRRILTASHDGMVRIWDAHSGSQLGSIDQRDDGVLLAIWNRDGSRVLALDKGGSIHQYHTSTAHLVAAACRRAPRNLTYDEWRRFLPDRPYEPTCPELPAPTREMAALVDAVPPPLVTQQEAGRSARVGLVGRNEAHWHQKDFEIIQLANIETLLMMSYTDPLTYERVKRENPDIEIITRLFGDGFGIGHHPTPSQFASQMIPIMQQLRPYVTKFQIHNEPNHMARYEGWGATDDDAKDFNDWFLEVYRLLKEAHPWAELGFPGLANPHFVHRDWQWLEICRPAIEQADWLGAHAYWQTPPGQSSQMMHEALGMNFKHYHEVYPDKPIEITEFGNSNIPSNYPMTDDALADEYVQYYQELFKYPYVRSASAFIMSSQDSDIWGSFSWRAEDGTIKPVVYSVGEMFRPPLGLASPDPRHQFKELYD